MEDKGIVELFWRRSEEAIRQAADKYGGICRRIANNIVNDESEAEECVNDAYLKLWLSIPPARPDSLSAFLYKIVRRLALDRFRKRRAEKRGGDHHDVLLSELSDCLPDQSGIGNVDKWTERAELSEALDRFLRKQSVEARRVFLLRYFYLFDLREIAEKEGISENALTVRLSRTRKALRKALEQEGIWL